MTLVAHMYMLGRLKYLHIIYVTHWENTKTIIAIIIIMAVGELTQQCIILKLFFTQLLILSLQGYKQKYAYIITQGPMRNTCTDFWKMVHDRKSGVIVMTSDLQENSQI